MVEKRPARIWWRKHRGAENRLTALALVTETPLGQFDVFVYQPGPMGTQRLAEETIEGSPEGAQCRADALVKELLHHECVDCAGWV